MVNIIFTGLDSIQQDKVIPGISKDDLPLIIRFRNKNDKADGADLDGFETDQTGPTTQTAAQNLQTPRTTQQHALTPHLSSLGGGVNLGPNKQQTQECYYWRTTGCDRERCTFKHLPAHKGIDKQSWMRRKDR